MGNDWGLQHSGGEQRHRNGFWDVRQKEDGGPDVRAPSAWPSERKGGQSGQKPPAASAGWQRGGGETAARNWKAEGPGKIPAPVFYVTVPRSLCFSF